MTNSCLNCMAMIHRDVGYSNYTIEGTESFCLKKLHPKPGFDNQWGESTHNSYANTCEGFSKGDPIEIDVDQERGDMLLNYIENSKMKVLALILDTPNVNALEKNYG